MENLIEDETQIVVIGQEDVQVWEGEMADKGVEKLEIPDESGERLAIMTRILKGVPTAVLQRIEEMELLTNTVKRDDYMVLYYSMLANKAYTIPELQKLTAQGQKMTGLVAMYSSEIQAGLKYEEPPVVKMTNREVFKEKLRQYLTAAGLEYQPTSFEGLFFPSRTMDVGTVGIGVMDFSYHLVDGKPVPLVFFPTYTSRGQDRRLLAMSAELAKENPKYKATAQALYNIANATMVSNGELLGQVQRLNASRLVHESVKNARGASDRNEIRSFLENMKETGSFVLKPKYPYRMSVDNFFHSIKEAEARQAEKTPVSGFFPVNPTASSSFLYHGAQNKQGITLESDIVFQQMVLTLVADGQPIPPQFLTAPIKPKREIVKRQIEVTGKLARQGASVVKTRNYGPRTTATAMVAKAFFAQFFMFVGDVNFSTDESSKSLLGSVIYKGALQNILAKAVTTKARLAYSDNNYLFDVVNLQGGLPVRFMISIDGSKMEASITRIFAEELIKHMISEWDESGENLDEGVAKYLREVEPKAGFDVIGILGDLAIPWKGMLSGTPGTSFYNNAKSIQFLDKLGSRKAVVINEKEPIPQHLALLLFLRANGMDETKIPSKTKFKESFDKLLTDGYLTEVKGRKVLTLKGKVYQPNAKHFKFTDQFTEIAKEVGVVWTLERVTEIFSLKGSENIVYPLDYLGCSAIRFVGFGISAIFPILELDRLLTSLVNQKSGVNSHGKPGSKPKEKLFYYYSRISCMTSLYLLGGWYYEGLGRIIVSRIASLRDEVVKISEDATPELIASAMHAGIEAILEGTEYTAIAPAVEAMMAGQVIPTIYSVFKVLTTEANIDSFVNFISKNFPNRWLEFIGVGMSTKHMNMFDENVREEITNYQAVLVANKLVRKDLLDSNVKADYSMTTRTILDSIKVKSQAEARKLEIETAWDDGVRKDPLPEQRVARPRAPPNPLPSETENRIYNLLQLVLKTIKGKTIIMVLKSHSPITNPKGLGWNAFITWVAMKNQLNKDDVRRVAGFRAIKNLWSANATFVAQTMTEENLKKRKDEIVATFSGLESPNSTLIIMLNNTKYTSQFIEKNNETGKDFSDRVYRIMKGPKDSESQDFIVVRTKAKTALKKPTKSRNTEPTDESFYAGLEEPEEEPEEKFKTKDLNKQGLKLKEVKKEVKVSSKLTTEAFERSKEARNRMMALEKLLKEKKLKPITMFEDGDEYFVKIGSNFREFENLVLTLGSSPTSLALFIPEGWDAHVSDIQYGFYKSKKGKEVLKKNIQDLVKSKGTTSASLKTANLNALSDLLFPGFHTLKSAAKTAVMRAVYDSLLTFDQKKKLPFEQAEKYSWNQYVEMRKKETQEKFKKKEISSEVPESALPTGINAVTEKPLNKPVKRIISESPIQEVVKEEIQPKKPNRRAISETTTTQERNSEVEPTEEETVTTKTAKITRPQTRRILEQ